MPKKTASKKTQKNEKNKRQSFKDWWSYSFQARFQKKSEISFFLEEVAMLMDAGLDIAGSVKTARDDVRRKSLRKILDRIEFDVSIGLPIWKSFKSSNLFPNKVVALIRVGEESGQLSKNLKAIVEQGRKDQLFKSRIQSAMLYPVLVMGATVFIGVGIAWFILPGLAGVFDSLGLELPLITRVLIWVGLSLQAYGYIIVPVFLLLIGALFYFVFFYSKTKVVGEWILLHIPGIGRLIKQIELSRLGFVVGGLMDAGLPIDAAFESLTRATAITGYKKIYAQLTEELIAGVTFEQFFDARKKTDKFIPNSVQQMIHSAEISGELPSALMRIGSMYEDKIEGTTKNLSVVLEPLLLVIVWIGVVGVALAVILPIYGLIGNLTDAASPSTSFENEQVEVPIEEVVDPVLLDEVESTVLRSEGPTLQASEVDPLVRESSGTPL